MIDRENRVAAAARGSRRMLLTVSMGAATGIMIAAFSPRTAVAPRSIDAGAALHQTLLRIDSGPRVRPLGLVTQDGGALDTDQVPGRFTLVFFGFTACPSVCPRALGVLSSLARHPAMAAGATRILFVSIDPEHDSPERLRAYLASFDTHIVGLTGPREAVERYAHNIGAGSRAIPGGIDHSTSVFVLDDQDRLAAVLLRPDDPARMLADLDELRLSRRRASGAGVRE